MQIVFKQWNHNYLIHLNKEPINSYLIRIINWELNVYKVLQISNLLLAADVSSQVANNSAVGMLGSFIAAAVLIVVPATAFLIFVSQKDSLDRTSTGRR